jgi:SAM-dependent methyltransferase
MTHRQAAANFDLVALPYRWMEYATFGRALQRCRCRLLPQVARCRSALLLGDGDGRFLAKLLAANPGMSVDSVDTSAAMLCQLTKRAHAAAPDASIRLRTHRVSALSFVPDRRYDLIVTHFFLDCLTQAEVESLCEQLAPYIERGALWLFSDFNIPPSCMRWPARAIVRLLYVGFRLLTGLRITALPDHAAALTAVGFNRTVGHTSLQGLLVSELWEYTPSMLPPQKPKTPLADPVPDPEPASPSLPEPDPAVFHPEPAEPEPDPSAPRS